MSGRKTGIILLYVTGRRLLLHDAMPYYFCIPFSFLPGAFGVWSTASYIPDKYLILLLQQLAHTAVSPPHISFILQQSMFVYSMNEYQQRVETALKNVVNIILSTIRRWYHAAAAQATREVKDKSCYASVKQSSRDCGLLWNKTTATV